MGSHGPDMNAKTMAVGVAVGLLALFTYSWGLDSLYIPKNGDEYVYTHITRLTASSGNLLPLQSELVGMRNTKPPLLFWQGIGSSDWGTDWELWRLRWPSVAYTLGTAGLLAWVVGRVSGQGRVGCIAALAYLCFHSTFRYGRPFLTDAPTTFWMSLPFFAWLLLGRRAAESWSFPLFAGASVGVAALYKSPLLVLPTGLAIPCGPLIPGFGQAGPATDGELLVELTYVLAGILPWAGAGLPANFNINVPADSTLIGKELIFQGAIIDFGGGRRTDRRPAFARGPLRPTGLSVLGSRGRASLRPAVLARRGALSWAGSGFGGLSGDGLGWRSSFAPLPPRPCSLL